MVPHFSLRNLRVLNLEDSCEQIAFVPPFP